VLPQFHQYQQYQWDNVKIGLTRMLWGFFKKVVIADRLAIAVDYCFGHIETLSGWALLGGAVFYSFQIYCDFSGYSDIGIGAARVMGVRLMENFDRPYGAHNITTFWNRWHISLSTWFRDYVYIPLGGNRRGPIRRRFNVFIVFLLSGLWHGARWTFVIWGALHGLLVTLFPARKKDPNKKPEYFLKALKIVATFLVVTICWVFFRAQSIDEAARYLTAIFSMQPGIMKIGLNSAEIILSLILIAILLFKEQRFRTHFIRRDFVFFGYFVFMVAVCYLLGLFEENQFIYFQF
jgi:D-alanyl-lipoteichoic acid acyltransferase DltB (MBOAT superfamily)